MLLLKMFRKICNYMQLHWCHIITTLLACQLLACSGTAVDEVELKLVSLELVDGTEIETEAGPDTDSKGTDGSNFLCLLHASRFTGYNPVARNPPLRWSDLNEHSQSLEIKPIE